MVKKLVKYGNSVALIIDKPIMEILNITNETTFEIIIDGKNLILTPQTENTEDIDSLNTNKTPNAETIAAMLEAEQLIKDPNTKRYTDIEELLRELKS